MPIRSSHQRKLDSIRKLEHERDVWVATANTGGRAHLVPFSLLWDGEHIIVATESKSRTTANVRMSRQARLAIGDSRDVVVAEAKVDVLPITEADPRISELFVKRTGWDPRLASGEWVYFVMTPILIQAWASEAELTGRTIMKGGKWIDDADSTVTRSGDGIV